LCFDIVTCVDFEKEGRRMPVPDLIPSWSGSADLSSVTSSALPGCVSSVVGLIEEDALDVWGAAIFTRGLCDGTEADLSLDDIAETFFRALKENFFGGSKELRMPCSFSESVLIV
jgi:hypothetical protein